jgi:hypothetical protein
MRALDGLGLFWLPGREDDALSGRLIFNPSGDGINLTLVGTFDNAPNDQGDADVRILGWLDAKKVTLDRCYSSGTTFRSPGAYESRYHANRMFLGHHFDSNDLSFTSVTTALSHLDDWVGLSGISERPDSNYPKHDTKTYHMSFTLPAEEYHEFSRGRVALVFNWSRDHDPFRGIEFHQWATLKIEYRESQPFEIVQNDVRHLQDLVTLCVDAPVAVDSFALKQKNIKAKTLSGEDTGHEQMIEFLAPPIRHDDPRERKPRHWHQMLLTYTELGGLATIARWLDSSERFQRALSSLMSTKYTVQMFAENRFLNVTFAAEAFHRITQGGSQMDEDIFEKLLATYLDSTPPVHQAWLRGKIQFGNEPPLRKRLRQLAGRSGTVTRTLIGDKDRWAYTLSQVRNELTHLGATSRSFSGSDLFFLAESAYAVVRICMLLDAGVSTETLTEKANSEAATWYRERLKQSIERVRHELASS